MKVTVQKFKEAKIKKEKITMLTAYDYSIAKLMDSCDVDGILIGDSLGMVALGYDDTLPVTVEDMIYHTKSVRRAVKKALIVSDMPFMSYQTSVYDAIKNAGRLVQEGGAETVKLEGGREVVDQIKGIIRAQIPVMGHIGLTPQSVNVFGGYKVQGKTVEVANKLIEDAKLLEDAGVFSIVLECVPFELAQIISEKISIPTIGIGSGSYCDGQILVYHDMMNINIDTKKKFVKVFGDVGNLICSSVKQYINEVKNDQFPTLENSFVIKDEVIQTLREENN